jgi:hypothetical protein
LPWLALGAAGILLLYTGVLRYLQHYAFISGLHDFWPPLVVLALFLAAWGGLNLSSAAWKPTANRLLLAPGVFLFVFAAYHHFGCWIGWVTTMDQTYWDQLAVSFLHGKLYLENPTYFHDLTFFQGHWYVPVPPLPGLVMVPATLLVGAGNLNAVRFSMLFAAINATMLFLILERCARLEWIRIRLADQLWIVALFAFGTPHLYVGANGQVWFFSQTLTVTCLALAIFSTLKSWPAWLSGIFLGLAVLARPNAAMMWPFLLAIEIQRRRKTGGALTLKHLAGWSAASGIPVALAVAGLLAYNQARFNNWLDFGYVTINGAEDIVRNARTYGLFNPHFIPTNLRAMFTILPRLQAASPFVVPTRDGVNIWLTTPALLFLFRRQSISTWKLGALASILLAMGMLLLYHNTGAFQFGYRYLLDFILPLLMLLAAGLGDKSPRLFRALVVLSVIINLLGTIWYAYNW